MKKSLLLFALLFSLSRVFAAETAVSDVRALGAVGDGTTVNTKVLQTVIDQLSAAGGGTVVVAGGRFVTGTLYLKSNITLRIEAGAVLLGSPNIADYSTDTDKTMFKDEPHMNRCLLFARDAQNITLEGRGMIDGQGKSFPNQGDLQKNRPMMIRFLNCTGVRMRDLTLEAPAAWTTSWRSCNDLAFDGLTIHSRANINGDGLDFDGCTDVRVTNSKFDNSDDCICLQASLADKPCRDIIVSNCHFTGRWSGMRIGLLTRGNIENVTVTNCTFRELRDSGLKIQMGEGAVLKNMVFSNLVMKNVLKPVFMTLSRIRAWVDAPQEFAPAGRMEHFVFSNIVSECEAGGKDAAFILTGLPGAVIEDVTFSDIRANFAGGGTAEHAAGVLSELSPENLKGRWPEYSRFDRPVPAFGFYARHVKGLVLRNVHLGTLTPDARPAVILDDVADAAVTDSPAPVIASHPATP